MDIKATLLEEHSKKQTNKIATYIGKDPEKFAALMKLFFANEYRVTQRAAWVMSTCADHDVTLIKPYLKRMLELLPDQSVHDAVKRNSLRIIQEIEIPKHLLGIAADNCFQLLESNQSPLAVKAFSMSILANICEKEPELKNELIYIIEYQLPYSSAGYKARARKVFKQLEEIK